MKKFQVYLLLLVIGFFQVSCKNPGEEKRSDLNKDYKIQLHPDWIMQGNIYEVNVRQYSPEGTFAAFQQNLDRLQEMGVQTLWFMPINPISVKERKGTLGSYYAVSNFTQVNPEFGDIGQWKTLVKAIHDRGMKVIIDWVPNHTGADHNWLQSHPDFFVKDSTGKASVAFDWVDVRQLDYSNTEMQDSMIAAMKYWITDTDIDGFRCDVAWNVPAAFWKKCINTLRMEKEIFMLAEGDKKYLAESGFDAVYPWTMFHMMVKIAKGERPAFALDSIKNQNDTLYPANTIQMYFTSNHDENSWNKADYETMPGAIHAPFAVLTQTMVGGVPLIYTGQEEPILRNIEFFEKDVMKMGKYARAPFYKTLLTLRKTNDAMAADASFKKVNAGNAASIYAYVREKSGKKVFVILNLSAKEQTVVVADKTLQGKPMNVFAGTTEQLSEKPWQIEPWGYVVYTY